MTPTPCRSTGSPATWTVPRTPTSTRTRRLLPRRTGSRATRPRRMRWTLFAANVKSQVMDLLWNPETKLIEHLSRVVASTFRGRRSTTTTRSQSGSCRSPVTTTTTTTTSALRLFADDAEYPIFPFYTANQADKAEAAAGGDPGSNNFSVINSTVTVPSCSRGCCATTRLPRSTPSGTRSSSTGTRGALPEAATTACPTQNEFWADGSADPQSIGYRSWIHHTILGATQLHDDRGRDRPPPAQRRRRSSSTRSTSGGTTSRRTTSATATATSPSPGTSRRHRPLRRGRARRVLGVPRRRARVLGRRPRTRRLRPQHR